MGKRWYRDLNKGKMGSIIIDMIFQNAFSFCLGICITEACSCLLHCFCTQRSELAPVIPHFCFPLQHTVPCSGWCERDPLSVRKSRLSGKKMSHGKQVSGVKYVSVNRSPFAVCSLSALLVLLREVERWAGAGRSRPLPVKSILPCPLAQQQCLEDSLLPCWWGRSSGCTQQFLSRAGARAYKALGWKCWGRDRGTRVELGRGFWQCIRAGRCRGACKQMQKEGKITKRSQEGCGDKHEWQSSEKKNRVSTYSARRDAAWNTGARLSPRGVMALLCAGHPMSLMSFLAIFHHGWKWDWALSAF